MVNHVLAAVSPLNPERNIVVVPHMTTVAQAVAPVQTVHQVQPLGTGDAVKTGTVTRDFPVISLFFLAIRRLSNRNSRGDAP